jgi:hypothetical protein
MWDIEEFIGSAVCDDVGVDVDDLGELQLAPQVDLGEGGVKIATIHEVQIRRVVISYAWNSDDLVINGLNKDGARVKWWSSYEALETVP